MLPPDVRFKMFCLLKMNMLDYDTCKLTVCTMESIVFYCLGLGKPVYKRNLVLETLTTITDGQIGPECRSG